jgi:hypothetical protein
MGLFDIFKKREQSNESSATKILLAMPMFTNGDRYDLSLILNSLKNDWNLDVSSTDDNNDTAVLTIDGEMVAIAFMPVPIPWGDIEGTAQYAYTWQTAQEELKDHTGHSIVSIMSGRKLPLDRFKLLTKVLYSILSTSNAIGIYQGNQSLLVPKRQYLDSAEELKNDESPINLWVYIGLRKTAEGNSVYTYGLTEFGKQEMEILNSKLNLDELYDFMANICAYVINRNVTFKDGETLGYTAEQKVNITSSKGCFVEGKSLKLIM